MVLQEPTQALCENKSARKTFPYVYWHYCNSSQRPSRATHSQLEYGAAPQQKSPTAGKSPPVEFPDMEPSLHQEAILQLLERARLPQKEVEIQLEKAWNPSYWRALNPQLSIDLSATPETLERVPLDVSELQTLRSKYGQEGFFQTQPILAPLVVERLTECVEILKRENWPPVFAFVYDELWLATRTPSLVRLLGHILGQGYKQTSHVWCHYVRGSRGEGGWAPHIDGSREDKRITVWIPLSDATLDNGCIYVVPRDLVSPEIAKSFLNMQTISSADASALLQSSRALPAKAGSILGWDYTLIHWGAKCGWPGKPRISIAVAFIASDTEPTTREPPLLDGSGTPPTFAQRLHLIGKGIQTYQKREPLMIRYQEIAQRLLQQSETDGDDLPRSDHS
jgi:hypothetical protein